MNHDREECVMTLDATANPLALVSERLARRFGEPPVKVARELRAKHLDLLEALDRAGKLDDHSHLLALAAGGVKWCFALARVEAHGRPGIVLLAFLPDELDAIADAVKRVQRTITKGAGEYLQ